MCSFDALDAIERIIDQLETTDFTKKELRGNIQVTGL
jgi:hypothetical protein